MTNLLRRALPASVIVAIAALAAAAGLLAPAERLLSDLRTRALARAVDSDVVVVAIDAHSLKAMNRWPWPRDVHAELLERLDAAAPRAVFFDVDFSVPSGNADADAALAEALARPRDYPVILPAFWQKVSASNQTSRMLTEPLPALTASARVGLVNMFPGPDGLVRNAVHHDRFGARDYRSAGAILAGRTDLSSGAAYPVDFRIAPESFEYVSYAEVLRGAVGGSVFEDRVVMIGATAVELGDNVPVPVYRTVPGVALQATIYQTLAQGIPVPLSWPAPLVLSLILALAWTAIRRRGWRVQFGAALAAALAVANVSLYLHGAHDLLLPAVMPLLTIVLCLFTGVVLSANHQTLSALLAGVRLKRQQALISGVFSASIDGILVLDTDGHVRDANPAAARLFGTKRAALVGRAIRGFLPELAMHRDDDGRLRAERLELRATTPSGPVPVDVSLSPAGDDTDGLVTAIVRDVSERHRQQAVLRHQATHDPLTRLPNRTLLNRMLERLPTEGGRAALFMLDLDGFKSVNDTLGHGVGDEVLRALGKRLRQSLPADVKVFRIGGDEFAVLVSRYAGRNELKRLAQQIVDRVRAPVTAGGTELELGGSIGIALYPDHADSGTLLLQCADVAMYTAKRGLGSVEFYDADSDNNTLRNLKMTGALRTALAQQRMQLVYQPKIRLADGACVGVEALLRWQDPELGVVSPAEFVPLAENSELINTLTRFTLERAIRDHARWCARGIDVTVAVNLSARHLTDAAFVQEILALVDRHGLDPTRLELEITETALMDHPERARAVLAHLTRRGVRLAMDDFGTGFSSLAYLKHLNLHTLKIDRCFVQDLTRNLSDRKIVESTLSMAHSLDLEVVAEGIEEPAQAALLAELGCEQGQGYAISKPLAPEAFVEWYQDRTHTSAHRPPALRSVSA
jgi:diguanylate cyclase (GGDEF)-like protein/PAS domain S-box-containing protein